MEDGSYSADFGGENDICSDDIVNDEYYDVRRVGFIYPARVCDSRKARKGMKMKDNGRSLVKAAISVVVC